MTSGIREQRHSIVEELRFFHTVHCVDVRRRTFTSDVLHSIPHPVWTNLSRGSFEQRFPEGGPVDVGSVVAGPRDGLGGVEQAADAEVEAYVVRLERGPDDGHDGVRTMVLGARDEMAALAVGDEVGTEHRNQPPTRADVRQQRLYLEADHEVVVVEHATVRRQVRVEPVHTGMWPKELAPFLYALTSPKY